MEVCTVSVAVVYKKKCLCCRKEYESTSRNQRYCSDRCAKSKNKQKLRRRREYSKTQTEQRLVSQSYYLAQKVAEAFLPKPTIPEDLELHHLAIDCFMNNPLFMMWDTVDGHKLVHVHLPKINVYKLLEEVQTDEVKAKKQKFYWLLKEGSLDFYSFLDNLWSLYKECLRKCEDK